jgi:hypothetical protein
VHGLGGTLLSSEIVLEAPDGLLGDVGHVESRFGQFGDSVSVGARKAHGLRQTYHMLGNCFGRTRWYSLVMRLKWVLILLHLEIVLILTQDQCTVCAKHTVGSKIILDTLDRTHR